jgi:hypothetical protein
MAEKHTFPLLAGVLAAACFALLAGCSSTPSRVEMVDIDPDDAAAQAMSAYDANKDGRLVDDELHAVPGILKWKKLYDSDGDGAVSEAEIVARLEKWQSDKLAFRRLSAKVELDGRPLKGVEVTLTPESYLGPALKPAKGVTNRRGYATLTVSREDMPDAIKARGISISGVYPGTYRIELMRAGSSLTNFSRDGLPLGDEVAQDTVSTTIPIELATP